MDAPNFPTLAFKDISSYLRDELLARALALGIRRSLNAYLTKPKQYFVRNSILANSI